MARCHTNCIEKPICIGFECIGRFIGRHPWWFLVIPVLTAAALGGGFYFLKVRETNDIEEQFTPINGQAKRDRVIVQEKFPENDSAFSVPRLTTHGIYASIIVVSEYNILNRNAFDEILRLYEEVLDISVGEQNITYNKICATVNGSCFSNAILDIIHYNASNIEHVNITFPNHNFSSRILFLGCSVGGVEGSVIAERVKAIRLFFYLRNETSTTMWLNEFKKLLSGERRSEVSVSYYTSLSMQEEFEANSEEIIPFFAASYALSISFSILSCLRLDNVRNKVWVAAFGVFSTLLAVLSSFGMLLYIGVPFVITAATTPFLILGIAVDDMFIMISCWQQTKVHNKVEDRLAKTYKEAAISITITTLTDVIVLYIGVFTPFGSVRSFCLYGGTAILYCYIFNITFFGAVLALNGRREVGNRHWLTCMKVPQECPLDRSTAYAICCVGGAYNEMTNTEDAQPINYFFKEYYGPFLTKLCTKVFVIFLYTLYLTASLVGLLNMQEGIDLKNLASDHSYVAKYYEHEDGYFSEYGPNVMVVVRNETFPYWNEKERSDLNKCLEDFQRLDFVAQKMLTSWLEEFSKYSEHESFDLNNKSQFMKNLDSFLDEAPMFRQDLNVINDSISASRFFVQTVNISKTTMEKKMLNELRHTAEKCQVSLLVYHPSFIFYDQYVVIRSNTVQNTMVATAVMLVISLLLIPNPLCSLWMIFAVVSVIVGVSGFMALWDVNLDSISMINLIMCIGFSVDFSAHISYAFVSNSKSSLNEKAIDALYTFGYPIAQGAVSTILGVVVLYLASSYIFRTFFKIMFLVILFGLLHGVIFIPVFLTFFAICTK